MSYFSTITSLKAAENALWKGLLVKELLFPAELGGRDRPDNLVFIPPHICKIKKKSTDELLKAVREGMNEVAVVPEYRGSSFVPAKITITAASSGAPPEYKLEIEIW